MLWSWDTGLLRVWSCFYILLFWAYIRPLVCDGMTALGPSVCYNYCNISSNVGGLIIAALKVQHVTMEHDETADAASCDIGWSQLQQLSRAG